MLHSLLIVEDDESHIELIRRAFDSTPDILNITFYFDNTGSKKKYPRSSAGPHYRGLDAPGWKRGRPDYPFVKGTTVYSGTHDDQPR